MKNGTPRTLKHLTKHNPDEILAGLPKATNFFSCFLFLFVINYGVCLSVFLFVGVGYMFFVLDGWRRRRRRRWSDGGGKMSEVTAFSDLLKLFPRRRSLFSNNCTIFLLLCRVVERKRRENVGSRNVRSGRRVSRGGLVQSFVASHCIKAAENRRRQEGRRRKRGNKGKPHKTPIYYV